MLSPRIGFVGQGYVGKSYADIIEQKGYEVVRYALEEPYLANKNEIKKCDIVFIAVPTPTTPQGFDVSVVRDAVSLVGDGKVVVIKSTVLPGTTEALQKEYPKKILLFSPEFLVAKTAAEDASHPTRHIIGAASEGAVHRKAAENVLALLPPAPFSKIIPARNAEMIKYAANALLTAKVILANTLYDVAEAVGVDWGDIYEEVGRDPRIGVSHLVVKEGGRGAGGMCFPKDFAALRTMYEANRKADPDALALLRALEQKNIALLMKSGKDLAVLKHIYGTLPEALY